MSLPQPILQPKQQTPIIRLPQTGTYANVVPNLPLKVYANSPAFISGAVDQVAFTYAMLGGEVLDIELTENEVYASYERAVLEYSYIANLHQAQNSLGSFLGSPTGTFDSNGNLISGSALSGSNAALKFPNFSLAYMRNISDEIAYEAGMGGVVPFYTASIDITPGQQTYDLTKLILDKADAGDAELAAALTASNHAQARIHKVYFKSPSQTWRFFGYYGGLTVVGNLNTYGQYADDSTFDVVPAWQNKLQAINYEINLYTRTSHYSYEIRNNKINLFPVPNNGGPQHIWFVFSFAPNPLAENPNATTGLSGVNNFNTLPFENIPFENINSIGKQWIRRYALAICKCILGNTRGKFGDIPIPGGSVTLNHADLLQQCADEMTALKEELKTILDSLIYPKVIEDQANIVENAAKLHQYIPKLIYVG